MARTAPAATTNERIAQEMQMPAEYLFKVLRALSLKGLVRTQRGKGGGVTLARPADQITILDVIEAIDPIDRILSCPLGLAEHESLCPLHRRLDGAIAGIEQAFRETTLDEIVAEAAIESGACILSPPASCATPTRRRQPSPRRKRCE